MPDEDDREAELRLAGAADRLDGLLLRLTVFGAEAPELLAGADRCTEADDLEAGLCDTAGDELRVVADRWVVAGLGASL